MRRTVRAGEVREGDRLIVPDGELILVAPPYPSLAYYGNGDRVMWLSKFFAAHRSQLVVVERPDPPITITVELTPDEADGWLAAASTSRTPQSAYARATAKVCAAIVAARAGDQTTKGSNQ